MSPGRHLKNENKRIFLRMNKKTRTKHLKCIILQTFILYYNFFSQRRSLRESFCSFIINNRKWHALKIFFTQCVIVADGWWSPTDMRCAWLLLRKLLMFYIRILWRKGRKPQNNNRGQLAECKVFLYIPQKKYSRPPASSSAYNLFKYITATMTTLSFLHSMQSILFVCVCNL